MSRKCFLNKGSTWLGRPCEGGGEEPELNLISPRAYSSGVDYSLYKKSRDEKISSGKLDHAQSRKPS